MVAGKGVTTVARTTITHADGSTTTVVSRFGCVQACGAAFWFVLGLFVLVYPAQAFPRPGAVVAYIVLAAVVAVAVWVRRVR